MKNEELAKPVVVSIASVIIFLLGFALTISAIIAIIAVTYLPLPSIYVIATIISLVIGPFLTLAGYNLWKMKKWAAQLAAIIVLFDLISTSFIHLSIPLDIGDILAWAGDIIILVLVSQSLKIMKKKE